MKKMGKKVGSLVLGLFLSCCTDFERPAVYFLFFVATSCLSWVAIQKVSKDGKACFRAGDIILALLLAGLLTVGEAMRFGIDLLYPRISVWFVAATFVIWFLLLEADQLRFPQEEMDRRTWMLMPVILILGWLPHFLCNYPGAVCNDARVQLGQIMGLYPLDNHNPVLDTMTYGLLFQAGRAAFGDDNAGIAVICAVQYVLMAMAFTYLIYEGYHLLRSTVFVALAFAFYILVPVFGGAGQIMLKDSLHMPLFVLMVALQVSLIREPKKLKLVLWGSLLVLVSLTRAMASFYVFCGAFAWAACAWIARKKKKEQFSPWAITGTVVVALALMLLWTYALLPAMKIRSYPTVEKYSLPFQQTAYVVTHRELDNDEKEIIDSVLDTEGIRKGYNPNLADPVKRLYKGGDMRPYWRLYFSWYLKYPGDMVRSFFTSYYKYFDPFSPGNENYRSYMADTRDLGLEITFQNTEAHQRMQDYVKAWENNPLGVILMGPGLYCWILLYALFHCRKGYRISIITLAALGLGLLLTPLNGETRYAYPVIACAPLMIALCGEKSGIKGNSGFGHQALNHFQHLPG